MSISRRAKRLFQRVAYQIRRGMLPFRQSGFSSFNDEEILNRYIAELLPPARSRTAVDVGAGDGRTGSNTLALFKSGWQGLGIEFDSRKAYKLAKLYQDLPQVFSCRLRVTPDNILPLLEAYGIERDFSVLDVDIDSYDYWVLDAILSRYRPRIVMAEINEKIPPPIKFRVSFDPAFQLREHFFGFSISCLEELCATHEYALLGLEYNNAFLAPAEIAGGRALTAEAAYRQGYLERPDRKEKFPRNQNMEILHSLNPEEGTRFIRQFFAQFAGKYEMSIAGATQDSPAPDFDSSPATTDEPLHLHPR